MAADGYLREILADGARPVRHRSGVRELLGVPDDGARIVFPALPRGGFVYLRSGGAAPTWATGATGVAEPRWEVQVIDDPAAPWSDGPDGPDGPDAPDGPGADGPARRPPPVWLPSPTGAAPGAGRPDREAPVAPPDVALGPARGTTVSVPGSTPARAASGAAAGPRTLPAGDPAPGGHSGPGAAPAPVASPSDRPRWAEASRPSVLPAGRQPGPDGQAPGRAGAAAAPMPTASSPAWDAADLGDAQPPTPTARAVPGRTAPQTAPRSALSGPPADPPRRPQPGWPDPPVAAPHRPRPQVAASGPPRLPDDPPRPPAPPAAAIRPSFPPVLLPQPPRPTGAAAFWERCHVGRLRGRILR